MIKQIMDAVSIPVMAKVRIGHTVEAQILQSVGVDYIDVSDRALYGFCTTHSPFRPSEVWLGTAVSLPRLHIFRKWLWRSIQAVADPV